ncbi:hypothetical protein KP509_03G003900 [Ceratopteris richardii]|nr:hypothetical protein KP509_03G003900 [Ceratopteris richardii]
MSEGIKNTTFVSEEKNSNMDKPTITVDTPLLEATKSTTFVSEQTASADSSSPAPLQLEVLMEETTPDAEEKTVDVDETATNDGTPPLEATKYSTPVQVDACLLRFLVGKGGKTKEKIQKDTSTRIKVPSPREAKHGACLVVEGPSQSNVDAAVSQIGCLLEQVIQSPSLEYSHFISLPLASHAGFILQVNKFHDSVMNLFAGKEENEDSAIEGLSIEVLSDFDEEVKASVEVISSDNDAEACENSEVADFDEACLTEKDNVIMIENDESKGIQPSNTDKYDSDLLNDNKTDLNEAFSTDKDQITLVENDESKEVQPSSLDMHDSDLPEEHEADDPHVDKFENGQKGNNSRKKSRKKGHGVDRSIFIKPATLHITVLMLKLWNTDRVAAAIDILQNLNSKLMEALDNQPVLVRLKGVECMKGSPARAHVLYAKVEDADQRNHLLCACNVIKEAFIEAGLVAEKDKKQEIKMHATLMNTLFRKRARGKRFGRRIPFDARPIISLHGSEEWGEYTITEAHLSERFTYDDNGYYHCCSSIKFPASTESPS